MIRMIPNYCEGCRRVCETQPMPYNLTIDVAHKDQSGSVVRRFCSLACLAKWAAQARKIRRCPRCHGTCWTFGFQANGRCELCSGRGSLPYPRVATSAPEAVRKALRHQLASHKAGGEDLEQRVAREYQIAFQPDVGDTDHLEDEQRGAGDLYPIAGRRTAR